MVRALGENSSSHCPSYLMILSYVVQTKALLLCVCVCVCASKDALLLLPLIKKTQRFLAAVV